MDIASIIGLLGTVFFISLAVEDPGALIDTSSLYLVVGATFTIVLFRSKLSDAVSLGAVIGKVFINKTEEPEVLIDQLIELATVARKDGMVALERIEISNRFLQKGVSALVDGTKPEIIQDDPNIISRL